LVAHRKVKSTLNGIPMHAYFYIINTIYIPPDTCGTSHCMKEIICQEFEKHFTIGIREFQE